MEVASFNIKILFAAALFAVSLCECLLADSIDTCPSGNPFSSDDVSAEVFDTSLDAAVLSVVPVSGRQLGSGHLLTTGRHLLLPGSPNLPPSTEALRLIRIDVAATLSHAVFTLSAPSPARVLLDFNDVPLAAYDVSPTPAAFAADLPSALLVPHLPQRCLFHAESDVTFVLSDFRLEAPPPPAAVLPSAPLPDLP